MMLLGLFMLLQDSVIERLGDEDLETRTRAHALLSARGGEAIPALLEALGHRDAEIRGRATAILAEQSPLDWAPYLGDSRACGFFRASFRSPLVLQWEVSAMRFADHVLSKPMSLSRFAETSRGAGHEVWVAGALRRADPDLAIVTWHVENPQGITLRLREGVLFVGYARDLESLKTLPEILVDRLLEEPSCPQAAWLLAQMMSGSAERGLLRALEREGTGSRAAFEVLTYAYAAGGRGPIDPRYARAIRGRLGTADWDLLRPLSVVARDHVRDLAPVLRGSYGSPNPWARYLAAAIANLTREAALHDPALFSLMKEPRPDLQREALLAGAAIAPRGEMDFAAMVEASLAQPPPARWSATEALRRIPERGLVAELARLTGADWEFAFQVLVAFDDDGLTDAFCDAVEGQWDVGFEGRFVPLLSQYAATGRRGRPVGLLESFVRNADEAAALGAVEWLAPLLREGALGHFSALLKEEAVTVRRRGVEGLYQAGRLAPFGSCLRAEFHSALLSAGAEESDPQTMALAKSRSALLADEAPLRYVSRLRGKRVLVARSGCGGIDTRIGWRPIPEAAIPRPSWK